MTDDSCMTNPLQSFTRSEAPSAEQVSVTGVLQTWKEVEQGRYPLRFGGTTWSFYSIEKPSRHLLAESAAATDALAQRNLPSVLTVEPDGKVSAAAAFAPGQVAAAEGTDPHEVFVRAVVHALDMNRSTEQADTGALVRAVSFAGLPATAQGRMPNVTLPAEDLRVWGRLEPERFSGGTGHYSSPLYRGSDGNVLAPVLRAMIALQYFTVGPVIESALLHGWSFRLISAPEGGKPVYRASVTLKDGRTVGGIFATPGPAAVKAYLAGLKAAGGEAVNLVPHPKDRFRDRILAVHSDEGITVTVHNGSARHEAIVSGTVAVMDGYRARFRQNPPADMVILDRGPTPQEVATSVELGILPRL